VTGTPGSNGSMPLAGFRTAFTFGLLLIAGGILALLLTWGPHANSRTALWAFATAQIVLGLLLLLQTVKSWPPAPTPTND
jgi:hypothetical protein